MEFLESVVIPILIIAIVFAGLALIWVLSADNQTNFEDYTVQTIHVYKGCTVYELWKEFGGHSSWDSYAIAVKELNNGRDIGNIRIGEDILIYVYMGEVD